MVVSNAANPIAKNKQCPITVTKVEWLCPNNNGNPPIAVTTSSDPIKNTNASISVFFIMNKNFPIVIVF